jgi:hypothetical protein
MVHTLLIAAHGASGLAALAAGSLALRPPARGVPAVFRVYLGALWLMVLFLLLVMALDWGTLASVSRLLYGALVVLAVYVAWRGWQGWQELQQHGAGWPDAYIEDVGFTVIALFGGFVIIGALGVGAPVWLVVALGVLGVLIGRGVIGRTKKLPASMPERKTRP